MRKGDIVWERKPRSSLRKGANSSLKAPAEGGWEVVSSGHVHAALQPQAHQSRMYVLHHRNKIGHHQHIVAHKDFVAHDNARDVGARYCLFSWPLLFGFNPP